MGNNSEIHPKKEKKNIRNFTKMAVEKKIEKECKSQKSCSRKTEENKTK